MTHGPTKWRARNPLKVSHAIRHKSPKSANLLLGPESKNLSASDEIIDFIESFSSGVGSGRLEIFRSIILLFCWLGPARYLFIILPRPEAG